MSDIYFRASRTSRLIRSKVLTSVLVLAAAAVPTLTIALSAGPSNADVVHTGCNAVSDGVSSGWCNLYPGNATNNVQELGDVSLDSTGTNVTVQTKSASTGVDPNTSFACLTATPAGDIAHRLQDTLCTADGGVWIPFTGGSLTIDLSDPTTCPNCQQFENTTFTVQVAANQDANNANGDSFYNNVSVTSQLSTGNITSS